MTLNIINAIEAKKRKKQEAVMKENQENNSEIYYDEFTPFSTTNGNNFLVNGSIYSDFWNDFVEDIDKIINEKKRTMDEEYGDGSNHIVCEECGFCKTCGDCKSYGCGVKK